MHIYLAEPGLFWAGVAISLWVLYQSITGKYAYKGRSGRREEYPRAFWFIMAFEECFAILCISQGLNLSLLGGISLGLVALTSFGTVIWAVTLCIKRLLKYPLRIFKFLNQGRPWEAALELQAFLAHYPGDRETLILLAAAYDRAGKHEAAWTLYTELMRQGGGWGRLARSALIRSQEKARLVPFQEEPKREEIQRL